MATGAVFNENSRRFDTLVRRTTQTVRPSTAFLPQPGGHRVPRFILFLLMFRPSAEHGAGPLTALCYQRVRQRMERAKRANGQYGQYRQVSDMNRTLLQCEQCYRKELYDSERFEFVGMIGRHTHTLIPF